MVKVEEYRQEVKRAAQCHIPWKKLEGKTILISGASGLIGTFLIDVLMEKNENIRVIALGRNEGHAKERLGEYWHSPFFSFKCQDINLPFQIEEPVDYIVHGASNTHPAVYASDPVGTIMTNVAGTKNMLDAAACHRDSRFLFLSSVEIYGENRGDRELFDENYCGCIDCNTLRAGYPEGKRTGEALCQAYKKEYGIDFVTVRLARTYGPTMRLSDTKAVAQFIKKAVYGENIVLKSQGNQFYSYIYGADAVTAVLTVLLNGKSGEVYNASDSGSDISLKKLASLAADCAGSQVVYELPDEKEAAGYSKATKARMDSTRLKALGWKAETRISEGIFKTINIMKKRLDNENNL